MNKKKSVVLIVVIGVLVVVFTLALVALYLMTQEARIAEHKIRRTRGVFAARAGMVHALEQIRTGAYQASTAPHCAGGTLCTETISVGDSATHGYPLSVTITYDSSVTTGPLNTSPVNISVDY